jgi:gamma-glutamyltranspeptidase
VTPALSQSMATNAARLKLFPAAAAQFLVNGQDPYPAAARLGRPRRLPRRPGLRACPGGDADLEGLRSAAPRRDRSRPREDLRPGLGPPESPQASTTDIAVIDRWGNAVSLTCTIEQEFGSAVVAPGTGFLLNNELTDFGAAGTANQAQAFKRPRSSISPEIVVQNGVPVLVDGGAGGARIVEGTLLPIIDTIDYGQDIAHAVDAERIDAAAEPLIVEGARMPAGTLAGLQARGHTITNVGEYDIRPRVQAAGIDPQTGTRIGVSDSRTEDGTYAESRAR